MLLELHITGLGVIEEATLELSPGLNVLTGETGAGKTLVTQGLALVLGRRARAGLVRRGADRARVEARFDASGVPAAADWAEDGELVLSRTVGADGRSSARAAGQLAPLSVLAELGAHLVEVHGQHQTERLLSPGSQLAFLDSFAGPEHLRALARYREAFAGCRRAGRRLARLEEQAREREREKDLLGYQVREIEAAGVRPGELAELEEELARLGHAEAILERLEAARAALAGDGGAADALAGAAAAAREAAGMDRGADALARRLASLAEEARDAAEDARGRAEGLHVDPARLEEVRERLAALRGLERKYGEGEAGILAYLEEARARLASLAGTDEERQGLEAERARLAGEVASLAAALSETRAAAARRLTERLRAELAELGMEGASIEVRLRPRDPGPEGAEEAEILLAGGPGQALLPLARAASGGELSRTMLACRTVTADLDDVGTLVFDEVDAGVGGRAGMAVGRRPARLAAGRQVLAVTHLPQIACFADRHFRVTKRRGTAAVEPLDGEARVAELSRMLSGLPTEQAAAHAGQLLEEAAAERRTGTPPGG